MASKDFRVYIANLGKYNEGFLVGGWFEPPLDYDEIAKEIGLNEFYEEYAIHDVENIPYSIIGEYCSIDGINEIYDIVQKLPDFIVDDLEVFIGEFGSLEELCNKYEDILYYETDGGIEDYARYLIDEEMVLGKIPEALADYIDYDAYARMLKTSGSVIELSNGVCEIVW